MDLSSLLYSLLTTGATLLATNAAGEFAKGAGKSASEALKARLTGTHKVDSLALLDRAADQPAYATAIKADLDKPEITADAEIPRLVEALRAAIAAIPAADEARYAVDIRRGIEAARNISLRDIEGLRAESIRAGEDLTMENIRAPGKSQAAGYHRPVPRRPSSARRTPVATSGSCSASVSALPVSR